MSRLWQRVQIRWWPAYLGIVVMLAVFGAVTRTPLLNFAISHMPSAALQNGGLARLEFGSYLGLAVSIVLLPLLVPWITAMIAKIISLFTGSRFLFSDFFRLFMWGNLAATALSVFIKGALYWWLPVEAWGRVSLGMAAFFPDVTGEMKKFLGVFDVPQLVLYLVAILMVSNGHTRRPVVGSILGAATISLGFQAMIAISMGGFTQ